MFFFGVSILSIVYGFKDLRQNELDKYSESIGKWEKDKRQEFYSLEIVAKDSLNNEAHLVRQEQDPMMIKRDNYTEVQQYTPAFFSISIFNSRKFNQSEKVGFNLTVFDKEKISNLTVGGVKAYRHSQVSVLRGACKSIGGKYKGFANCELLWKLTGFCVKIQKISSLWEFDEKWGYFSCGPDGSLATYEVITDDNDLGDITYEIRSSADPLIYGKYLMRNRQNFGLPGLYWKTMGFISMILSLFLLAQPTIYFKKRIYGELKESPVLVEFQPRKPEILQSS